MDVVQVTIDVGDAPVVVPCLVAGPRDIAVPAALPPALVEVVADRAWEAHVEAVEVDDGEP